MSAPMSPERLRAEADAELQAAVEGLRDAWNSEVDLLNGVIRHLRAELTARPTRAEVLREAADDLAEDEHLLAAEELRQMSAAAEQSETGAVS